MSEYYHGVIVALCLVAIARQKTQKGHGKFAKKAIDIPDPQSSWVERGCIIDCEDGVRALARARIIVASSFFGIVTVGVGRARCV